MGSAAIHGCAIGTVEAVERPHVLSLIDAFGPPARMLDDIPPAASPEGPRDATEPYDASFGRRECHPDGLGVRHEVCGIFAERERGGGLQFRSDVRRWDDLSAYDSCKCCCWFNGNGTHGRTGLQGLDLTLGGLQLV